ncbi:alpha/beta fold hydrolase [Tateyamaria sp. SN3-11]|uniref:alpha/beta fold hydrolase n=1 Tax=Tateyamaria sp. SN3-11 TaxID=3092147 RepID=UPI0039E8DC63
MALVTALALLPERPAGTRIANIAYGDLSSRQRLDLYLPDAPAPHRLVVFVHGGGFSSGHKRAANPRAVINAGIARGYAVASVNYRRSREALFPAAVEDVIAALRFLDTEAHTYGLRPGAVAVWGASAGGNLAAMAALSDDTALAAAVIWFAPIRFDQMDSQFAELGIEPMLGPTGGPNSPESRYLGVAVGTPEAANLVQQSSPLSYITDDDMPVLIQHGSGDRNVPILQSETFARSLAKVLGTEVVVFDVFDGAGHGGDAFLAASNMDRIFSFLDAAMAP